MTEHSTTRSADERSTKRPAGACPDAEVLSAYLAGRLRGAEKAAVTEHLAGCEDCYFVFAESARIVVVETWWDRLKRGWRWPTISHSRWTLVAGPIAGLAAAALVLTIQPQLQPRWWPGRSEVADLVAAVGTSRRIEPRLTGGFAYAPLLSSSVVRSGDRGEPDVRRGGSLEQTLSPDLRIAAIRTEQRLQDERKVERLQAFGAAQLLVGRTDQAVSAFEEATRLAPKEPRLQSDLAAAYLVRFNEQEKDKKDLENVTKAVAAATQATEANPSLAEARFNLALALEALSLRNEARKAWEEYLKVDPNSPWAQEARKHIEGLSPEKQSQRFEEEHRQVADAAAAGDRIAALAAVKQLPDVAYDYVENELLPQWADARLKRDGLAAHDVLQRARLVGDALAETIGERMAIDAVIAIERAGSHNAESIDRLARGHQLFRDARVLYNQQASSEAADRFRESWPLLASASSPF